MFEESITNTQEKLLDTNPSDLESAINAEPKLAPLETADGEKENEEDPFVNI